MLFKRVFFINLTLILFFLNTALFAENNKKEGTKSPSALETLEDLSHSIKSLEKRIIEQENIYTRSLIEEHRLAAKNELSRLLHQKEAYKNEFEEIVSGVEVEDSNAKDSMKPFKVEEELMEVLRPLIEALKQMTSKPRELERLKKDLAFYEEKLPVIQQALKRIKDFSEIAEDPLLKDYLSDILVSWQEREKEGLRQIRRINFQLDQKQEASEPMLVSMQKGLINFIKTRGRNLFFAFTAFMASFFGLRYLYWKWSSKQKKSPPPIHHRLLQVIFHSTTALISISIALFLLYIFGDWMLLSIALLLILALIWSARNSIARFWEQGKLILNIGTLKEGERVIYNRLPWLVERLAFQGVLVNPELEGGVMRIPLKHLVGMQSRAFAADEPWFPSSKNDILLLSDGKIAKVLLQTPEQVVTELEGGSRRTWPTSSFLRINYRNLSKNDFGIATVLSFNHDLKDGITKDIPEKIKSFIEEKIKNDESAKFLKRIESSFSETDDYYFKIRVFAVFKKDAAARYMHIKRLIQALCLDACLYYNWEIPMPKLLLHNKKE